ncbi:MAG: aminoglycoside phosphotransferase family protein [Bacilli bacterium]|nr:aminoglycoside phosphotransferase family protein [Bacilli bacterium]
MKYVDNLSTGKKVIIERYPQFIDSIFVEDTTGWDNYVVKVDNEYIFRFSRDEGALRTIKMEYDVLSYLHKELPSNIEVPNFIFSNLDSDYPFVGYKMIKGKFLSNELYNSMTEEEKKSFIKNMMTFTNILHGLDINRFNLDVEDPYEIYKMRFNEFKEKCFPVFDEELKQKSNLLFNNYFNDKNMMNINKTVIHGDLSSDHIIITEKGVGVIDFGDTRVFDNAYDFQWLYMLGEDTLDKALTMYNNKIDDYFKKRVQFYTSIIPYHGVVYALETNNNEMLKKEIKTLKKAK